VSLRCDARRGQAGQTLIMFAITMTFMFLALIALVGDSDVLMVRYSQVNSEALLGAQSGATAVDQAAFYRGDRDQAGNRPLDPNEAVLRCQTAALSAGGPPTTATCSVDPATDTVTAVVSQQVTLPIPLFAITAPTVRATRTARPVFGNQQIAP
jgi:hypothetical protein